MTEAAIPMADIKATDKAAVEAPLDASVERRDDIGRLVSSTWHSSRTGLVDSGNRWLVAVDGSSCSLRAVAMAARLAGVGNKGSVDLVHVQPWMVKEAAETQLAVRGLAATAAARQLLDEASVPWRLHVVMGEAAAQIVAMAELSGTEGLDALDGVVIGSRGQSLSKALVMGSVAEKVLHQVKLPVMIVR